ncbi:carboxypeptidase-like regulatory domain-containing protein [Flavobacteriaceae bacterium S356]|uniref:Carboxypeptidase-like regulatory domain-containing protein n=1 Tax=Asprobacillus argus TaxID=3076534 RepID=A0ABU3LBM7_9FLAO|nr:carboxypeptidase-like regulatory domain-containing protein [Flavobacteriaceae bacterium S356]
MKKTLYILFLLVVQLSHAQLTIKGNVSSKSTPLEGAAVYINNSSIGTTTDGNGNFELKVSHGRYDIIVSFLGFKTINYDLNTEDYASPLIFKMKEEANLLDEIVLRNTIYDQAWKHNLAQFEISFIGTSAFSKNVKILNPKALHFEFDRTTMKLEAFAKVPLKIENKALGYLVTYDLVSFSRDPEKITYVGYTRYEDLKGSRSKKRKWKKNRLKAYQGSKTHFFKSLLTTNLSEDGFVVNQFRRVKNPNRPSDKEIENARKVIRSQRTSFSFPKKIINPKTALDSAIITVRKSRLPKFSDYLYKQNVPYNKIIKKEKDKTFLVFKDYLSIIYTKEKEEINFINTYAFGRKKAPGPQTSALVITKPYPYILRTGQVINPLDIFFEGYWGFEKMAETLPLDYVPPID